MEVGNVYNNRHKNNKKGENTQEQRRTGQNKKVWKSKAEAEMGNMDRVLLTAS